MANVSSFSGAMPVIPGGTVELGYQALTATSTNITYTGMPTTQSLIGPMTVVTDGSPLLVEFFAAEVKPPTVAGGYVCWSIYVDGSERTRYFGVLMNETTTAGNKPVYLSRRLNDVTAGSHTVEIRVMASSTSGTPAVYAATETSTTASAPAYLRVSKIVNQNDGLKPFWTPPVVTSLPSQATEGDQVLLYSSSPYAGYQTHQYASGSWRTLDDSRGTGAWQSFTPTLSNGWANGNATVDGKYVQMGKTVIFRASIKLGSTTTKSANGIQVNLPVTASATYDRRPEIYVSFLDAGTADYFGQVLQINTTTIEPLVYNASGTYLGWSGTSQTVPFTWTTNDIITYSGFYEAA